MPSSTLTHPPWILADTIINNHSPPSLINPSHAYINHSSTTKAGPCLINPLPKSPKQQLIHTRNQTCAQFKAAHHYKSAAFPHRASQTTINSHLSHHLPQSTKPPQAQHITTTLCPVFTMIPSHAISSQTSRHHHSCCTNHHHKPVLYLSTKQPFYPCLHHRTTSNQSHRTHRAVPISH
jgi:hypothetical protein